MAAETRAWDRVRALGPPDWPSIVRVMEVRELPVEAGDLVEAHNVWLCGDEIDTPCTLYLTMSGFVIHDRPDVLGAETIEWVNPYRISKAGAGTNDAGDPRLVIVWRDDDGQPRGVAIDFERAREDFVGECAGNGIAWSRGPLL